MTTQMYASSVTSSEEILKKLRSEPEPKIFGYAKVGREEHLQLLRQGRLFCRRHSYYRTVEAGKAPAPFQDVNDGIGAVLDAQQVVVQFTRSDGSTVTIDAVSGLVGGVLVSFDYENPIFCMHAIYAAEWGLPVGAEGTEAFQAALQIPSSMDNFGTHIWIITNGTEFFRRLHAACDARSLQIEHRLVRYIDDERVYGMLPESLQPYVKLRSFEQERECRILLGAQEELPDPFVFDIGPLDDISVVVPLREFRAGWSLGKRA